MIREREWDRDREREWQRHWDRKIGTKRHREIISRYTTSSKYVCLDHFPMVKNLVATHAMSKMHTIMFQNSDPKEKTFLQWYDLITNPLKLSGW